HPYATNSRERLVVPFGIAATAVLLAFVNHFIMTAIAWHPPFWLEIPGTFTLYGLSYELFRRRLWRLQPVRTLCRIRVPNLEGHWRGVLKSSFDEHAAKHSVTVDIKQTWTDISVRLNSEHSCSRSLIGAITVDDEDVLFYEYLNEPRAGSVGTMHTHRGTV